MPRAHEREWGVRMKGQIDGGNIAPDGLIPNWGRLRSGTLAVSTSGLFSVQTVAHDLSQLLRLVRFLEKFR